MGVSAYRASRLAALEGNHFPWALAGKFESLMGLATNEWGRRDSNPHALRHMILNHARLPIPTLPHERWEGISIIACGRSGA